MMKLIGFGVLLCGFLLQAVSSYGFGRCPKYPSMPKFNLTKVSLFKRFLFQYYGVQCLFHIHMNEPIKKLCLVTYEC